MRSLDSFPLNQFAEKEVTLMSTWQPIYRPGPYPKGQFTLTPTPGFKACVLVEKQGKKGSEVARLQAYVCIDPTLAQAGTLGVQYTPNVAVPFWIVDIPDANNIDLGQIATAIANGGGVELPPPPIVWG